MITFTQKGDFRKTENFLKNVKIDDFVARLEMYGQEGVNALSAATPKDSGKTASSWSYEIRRKKDSVSIVWSNSNVNNNVNIAILLQYGHGTRNGGYVQGRDYINPVMRPIFDRIAETAWKEVSSR